MIRAAITLAAPFIVGAAAEAIAQSAQLPAMTLHLLHLR
jgi:hypothetical protein